MFQYDLFCQKTRPKNLIFGKKFILFYKKHFFEVSFFCVFFKIRVDSFNGDQKDYKKKLSFLIPDNKKKTKKGYH
jgi:hypothetical protein